MPAVGQQALGTAAADTVNATFGVTPTSGNLLLALCLSDNTAATITVSGWSLLMLSKGGGTSLGIAIYYKYAGVAEPTTVTAVATGANATRLHIMEITGAAASGALGTPLDSNGIGVTSLASGSISIPAGSLGLAICGCNGAITAPLSGAPWVQQSEDVATKRLWSALYAPAGGATSACTFSWTTSRNARTIAVAIHPPGGGVSTKTGFLGFMMS